jgi:hypothetical protein
MSPETFGVSRAWAHRLAPRQPGDGLDRAHKRRFAGGCWKARKIGQAAAVRRSPLPSAESGHYI